MSVIPFQSSKSIQKDRQDIRDARRSALENAKRKYEKEEKIKEKAREQGEGTWMLSSVSHRIDKEQRVLEKHKKHKKDKKKKKTLKKEKKKKKKKKQDSESSSSSDDTDADDDSVADEKVERNIKGPVLQRDSWMDAPLDLIPTVNSKDLREQRLSERKQKKAEPEILPGQYANELNPYWKDGGTGLPQKTPTNPSEKKSSMGDGGLSWLRKSYNRCKEQAEEEGRSLEDVAADRWGSLEELERQLADAEKFVQDQKRDRFGCTDKRRVFRKPGEDGCEKMYKSSSEKDSSRLKDSYSYKKSDSHSSDQQRDQHSSQSRLYSPSKSKSKEHDSRSDSPISHSRSRERYHSDKKQSHSRSRSRERTENKYSSHRSRSRSPYRSGDKYKSKYNRCRSRSRSRDRKSDSKDRYRHHSNSGDSSRERLKSRFMKPSDEDSISDHKISKSTDGKDYIPAWKKKTFLKPNDETNEKKTSNRLMESQMDKHKGTGAWKKEKGVPSTSEKDKRHRSVSGSSSTSESSVSSMSSESESDSSVDEPPPPPVAKVLTELEMNALGAKILRAELMGDEEMAQKLKSELEAAQKAKSEVGSVPVARETKTKDNEGDNVVVLTKTGRDGMVKPVDVSEHTQEQRRRKRQKVMTHEDKGKRTKYFDDDDKYDLKQLVEREKLGSAEDQNMMFARLANRETDRDLDVDDMFVNKAAHKQSEAHIDNRERLRAIEEHRKISSAMDNCHFCFEKVPKHLIISIGTKVYLCLPNHRSLTEGHCLIVPMQHISSSTMVEEDVWEEMQTFRKFLTQMFEKRDLDVVFMETSMNLKRFPHTCIECVPMEKEVGDLAPIYFKKAIQECEKEWADNKKLVDLSKKDIRRSVPKGFPYFSVDFGMQGGFAHVIEDEKVFPGYFGREIIGGMIDAEPRLWRKPMKENFEDQRKKVLEFSEWFKPYDWTQNLSNDD